MARRTAPDREPLTRDRILRAALELADEGGIASLTMQAIGRRLGVEAMSLYRHVHNKEAILDGIVDLVFGEIEVPAAHLAWKPLFRARSFSVRDALRRHPWAIVLLESRMAPGPENLRSHDEALGALLAAGFSPVMATHASNLLDSYILGFAIQEVNLPFSNADELAEVAGPLAARLPADVYPHLARASTELLAARFDYADEFEYGLDLILDGIERAIAGNPGGDPPRR
jgi:AcrR family transcriptional regulator